MLPRGLKELQFGHFFNQRVDKDILPHLLEILSFGHDFNQPIGIGVFPQSLKELHFGTCYNQPLAEGALPQSLETRERCVARNSQKLSYVSTSGTNLGSGCIVRLRTINK